MGSPEEMSAKDLVRRVIEEAKSLEGNLQSPGASGEDIFDSAVRMRILTGTLCHRILNDRKEGKPQDA